MSLESIIYYLNSGPIVCDFLASYVCSKFELSATE